jgi:DNA polymerase III delta subunit
LFQLKLIKSCLESKMNSYEIVNTLSYNSWVVNKNIQLIKNIPIGKINQMLHKLSDIDYKFKTGEQDLYFSFKLFLLS